MATAELTNFLSALGASAAFLALTVLAASRGRRDPVARSLAILCVDMCAYCSTEALKTAKVVGFLPAERLWDWINNASASMSVVLFYHLVATFVGRRRALRPQLSVAYAYFGGLALLSLSPIVVARADPLSGGAIWAGAMLLGMIAIIGHGIVLLARHLREASAEESARARLLVGAAMIAGAANSTDLFDIAGAAWFPHLGALGLLASSVLLTFGALRWGVFERLSILATLNALAIALVVVLAEVSVFRFAGHRIALAVVCTVLVALGALVALRFVVNDYAASRERTLAHATLGRMAAQMAHDIKNPLAAIRGAAQFLATERASHRSIDAQIEFLDLLVSQCDRLGRIVDQYHRIGRSEPVLHATDLNDAVREATRFLGTKAPIETRLSDAIPMCQTDRDLLVIALENVLRNANEAAVDRVIHVTTTLSRGEKSWAIVSVRDEGPGMDPRTRERALEGFFTTKSHGSGLGLTFVRRVVEAHDGRLSIDSEEGAGTTVNIALPIYD
jgi:signal transduction histidine kinase